MIKVKELIASVVPSHEDNRHFAFFKAWHSCIGSLSKHVRLEAMRGTTLVLGVYEPHWVTQLYLLSPTIIQAVNTAFGSATITKLHLKLVSRRTRHNSRAHLAQRPQHSSSAPLLLQPQERQALEMIKDHELKQSLFTLLHRIREGTYAGS